MKGISVKDRLPSKDLEVFMFDGECWTHGIYKSYGLDECGEYEFFCYSLQEYDYKITHWKPYYK